MMLAGRDWRARRGTGDTNSMWIRSVDRPYQIGQIGTAWCTLTVLGGAICSQNNMACCGVGAKSGTRERPPEARYCAQFPIATVHLLKRYQGWAPSSTSPSVSL